MGYKKYSDEFKRDVLAMVAEGSRSVVQLEHDLDITPGVIYKWQQRYRVTDDTLQPSAERAGQAELRRLRRSRRRFAAPSLPPTACRVWSVTTRNDQGIIPVDKHGREMLLQGNAC